MAVPQITARLSPTIKKQFEQYAASFGLGVSELAKLLIVRERHQKRLIKLKGTAKVSRNSRQSTKTNNRLPTITTHLSSLKDVEDFDAYVRECGFSRSSAGAFLFEAEMQERWLEKAISSC